MAPTFGATLNHSTKIVNVHFKLAQGGADWESACLLLVVLVLYAGCVVA
jgi:hypothetical protein